MRSIRLLTMALVLTSMAPYAQGQEDGAAQDEESWLPSLIAETPQEGKYSHDPDSLIAASEVVAIHFRTIAAANDYWRDRSEEE